MKNILIVDDMLVNRKLMKKVLSDSVDGIFFVEAEDGFQALDRLDACEIDLVILDLMMPGKDGYEVLAEMKQNPKHRDIPVIVNSAITDMDSIKKTLELGAMDYFTKPITPEQMKVIIPLKANNALIYYEQRKNLKRINQRMEKELKIASMLQRSLITKKESYQRMSVYQKYVACEELGGDLFDYVELGGSSWFMIADITGHGVAAALVASMLKVSFNHAIASNDNPASVLEEINRTFCNLMDEETNLYFSVFVGLIQEDEMTYSNAGHPYPLLIKQRKESWQLLESNGYLIGLVPDAVYHNQHTELKPGEAIFTYTDGLFETPRQPKNDTSYISVMEHALKLDEKSINTPESFMNQMMASFGKTDNKEIDDDIALMYLIKK